MKKNTGRNAKGTSAKLASDTVQVDRKISSGDSAAIEALLSGRHGDPFSILGPHRIKGQTCVRVLVPGAIAVRVAIKDGTELTQLSEVRAGFFAGALKAENTDYLLYISWPESTQVTEDPYSFEPLLGELDLYLIGEGRHGHLADCLGAHETAVNGIAGTRFAVWAPNASRVSVVGDFNSWDGRRHPMRRWHFWVFGKYSFPGLGQESVINLSCWPGTDGCCP